MEKEKKKKITEFNPVCQKLKFLPSLSFRVCYGMLSKVIANRFSFRATTEKTTAAPGEETTAVQPGRKVNKKLHGERLDRVIEFIFNIACHYSCVGNIIVFL